ncbi:MAG: serine/threonine-protein kinase [Pseudomonadota bacterium]
MTIRPRTLADGRYELDAQVGEGSMGTVFRATDTESGEIRAIKLLSPGLARAPILQERFRREAEILTLLKHRNIVRVHDFRDEGGVAYLVMDYVDGGSLKDWVVRHGPMPARMAVGQLLQVCGALAVAHEHGIVHRDIKPANLLIASDGSCRVVDFGIARLDAPTNLTRQGIRMGTLGFMAPEQMRSAHDVDHRADIYAMGATLFALLTASVPTDMEQALARDYARLPEPVAYLVTKATFPLPEQRYAGVQQLAAVLERTLERLPSVPASAPPLYEPVLSACESQVTGPTIVFD